MGKICLVHIFLFLFLFLFLFFSFFSSFLATLFLVCCNFELFFLFVVIIITINLVIFYFFESRTQSCPMVARNMCSSLASL